jgi:hypothetical protein
MNVGVWLGCFCTKEEVDELLPKAQRFIEEIDELLK